MTKTESIRTVELAPELQQLVKAHLAPTTTPAPAAKPSKDALVFTNAAGGPVHQTSWLRNHYKPAVRQALPDHDGLRFHESAPHVCQQPLDVEPEPASNVIDMAERKAASASA